MTAIVVVCSVYEYLCYDDVFQLSRGILQGIKRVFDIPNKRVRRICGFEVGPVLIARFLRVNVKKSCLIMGEWVG